MKLFLRLLIFVFIMNQVLPTIVAFIDDDVAFSVAESNADDEDTDCKDFQINCYTYNYSISLLIFKKVKSKICSQNNLIVQSLPSKIFLTPPELV